MLGSSAPVNIPGSALSERNTLGSNFSPSTSSPLQQLQSGFLSAARFSHQDSLDSVRTSCSLVAVNLVFYCIITTALTREKFVGILLFLKKTCMCICFLLVQGGCSKWFWYECHICFVDFVTRKLKILKSYFIVSITSLVVQQDGQCTYHRNIDVCSCNHCCRGKALSITYSE